MNPPGFRTRFRHSLFIGIALFSLASCSAERSYQHRESDRIEAESTTKRFYELLQKDSLGAVPKMLIEKVRRGALPDHVIHYAKYLNDSLGTVREITLDEWGSNVVEGASLRADYELVYRVARSRRVTREALVLRRESGVIRIRGWIVSSDGLKLPPSPLPADN